MDVNARPLTIAVIAGESSGDLLGADAIAALRRMTTREITLIGIGGPGLAREGLVSLFDFSELSIMGFSAVIAKLPTLIGHIRRTAQALIAARPDLLLIIDSPDFTHRVARKVKAALPDLPVINYVCPSVWAWKEYRAPAMRAYVDHVLALLPFEPAVMRRLHGPETHFVGHRLAMDPSVLAARLAQSARVPGDIRNILLLPGSRRSEIRPLLPDFRAAVEDFVERCGPARLILPTVPHQEELVRSLTADWPLTPEIVVGPEAKWKAFAEADVALAASGTVVLELALCHVPVISTYRTDWLAKFFIGKIKVWSAALPNLIADYVVVPEYLDLMLKPGRLSRWLERLSSDTPERRAMLAGFARMTERMQPPRPPGEAAAEVMLSALRRASA